MKRVENVILTIVLVFFWLVILSVTFLLWIVSDVFRCFGNGILPYLVGLLYILAFLVPILLRKRLKGILSMPATFILSTIAAAILAFFALAGARSYISEFSTTKWERNPRLRTYMIEDLETEHAVVGMQADEILELLGDPTESASETVWEYYVGMGFMDPYGYQITFENQVAVSTELIEH